MGLFDKFVKDVVKNTIGEEEANKLKDKLKNIAKEDFKLENKPSSKEVPSDYSHFPMFDKPIDELSTKNENKYKRCTMDFYGVTNEEVDAYSDKITSLGYDKKTNVRYEKDNEYIIVDEHDGDLNLVFHIKF